MVERQDTKDSIGNIVWHVVTVVMTKLYEASKLTELWFTFQSTYINFTLEIKW